MVNKWSINRVQQNAGDYGKQQVKKQKVLLVPNKNTMILQSVKLNIAARKCQILKSERNCRSVYLVQEE
jgi:hypothetical protein